MSQHRSALLPVVLLVALLLPATAMPASAGAVSPPSINSASFSPSSLPHTGGTIMITAHVVDNVAVSKVVAQLSGDLGGDIPMTYSDSDNWVASVNIGPNTLETPLTFYVHVYAYDNDGTMADLFAGEGSVAENIPFDEVPIMSDPSVAPTNLPPAGGDVTLEVSAFDLRGISEAYALVTPLPGDTSEYLPMEGISSDRFQVTFAAPANTTGSAVTYAVSFVALDDIGQQSSVEGAPFTVAAIGTTPVATGLDFPAGFTFAPDGRIFYGERFTGRVGIRDPATGSDRTFHTFRNVSADGEQGLLGIALHPDYPAVPAVYVFVTRVAGGVVRNEIVRLQDAGSRAKDPQAIFSSRATTNHNGGRIAFGPDGLLYAVVGDGMDPAMAQQRGSSYGKILRMTEDGAPAPDNPRGTRMWAYGIRNSFGFDWDPQTGRMWETENGPQCNDEVNRIGRGRNYGWGANSVCSEPPQAPRNTNRAGSNPFQPLKFYAEPIAPTGVAFCADCGLGAENEGHAFVGTWRSREIRRIRLGSQRWRIAGDATVLTWSEGILAVERAPDGALHFSDSSGIYQLVQ